MHGVTLTESVSVLTTCCAWCDTDRECKCVDCMYVLTPCCGRWDRECERVLEGGTQGVSVFWKVGQRVSVCFGRWDRECERVMGGGAESERFVEGGAESVSVFWMVGQRV